jgi:hypothetical protein
MKILKKREKKVNGILNLHVLVGRREREDGYVMTESVNNEYQKPVRNEK